ncbi:PREDICTED: uncharacterized protein LOC106117577 isoform X1 [Papilio xuthus]|uniref:Uncharacterized protein LOC106117577 isoform X1 n=1 Tax=Papilio xuthus TaxID=66420 RepID=A0AAJ6Z8K8_PAPXU|nr:PREDICTED: uncharacterized protein LOC106117577 isoform X1 [Papilio xuthus]
MAPPPEYDKEPKAPDKSVTNISTDDSKVLYNLVKEQQNNSDHKPPNAAANADVENNKHVGALDDGQLRALLDEAIAYKRPKDREGKSSLFKELLEEVEQDEQACEAAARSVTGRRGARGSGASGGGGGGGGSHGRRALPHSNSLQDLMAAALAAEQPRQRAHAHPPPASVSARAHHGGSLPSGVDTSFMLSEEPTRGGYLATVRCVNPPPLAERRVSASDANGPAELEHLNRRSKPMFPVTYTARATLEIGSGSVCSGRAVTTTTPSNQVRTPPRPPLHPAPSHAPHHAPADNRTQRLMDALAPKPQSPTATSAPTEHLRSLSTSPHRALVDAFEPKTNSNPDDKEAKIKECETIRDLHQSSNIVLMEAFKPKSNNASNKSTEVASTPYQKDVLMDNLKSNTNIEPPGMEEECSTSYNRSMSQSLHGSSSNSNESLRKNPLEVANSEMWIKNVNNWYDGLHSYFGPNDILINRNNTHQDQRLNECSNIDNNIQVNYNYEENPSNPFLDLNQVMQKSKMKRQETYRENKDAVIKQYTRKSHPFISCSTKNKTDLTQKYTEMKKTLVVPTLANHNNPRNFRNTTIGNIEEEYYEKTNKSINNGDKENNQEEKFKKHNLNLEVNDDEEKSPIASKSEDKKDYEMKDMSKLSLITSENNTEIELLDFANRITNETNSFSKFVEEQRNFFKKLEYNNNTITPKSNDIESKIEAVKDKENQRLRSEEDKDCKIKSHTKTDKVIWLIDNKSEINYHPMLLDDIILTKSNSDGLSTNNTALKDEKSEKDSTEKLQLSITNTEQIANDKKAKRTALTMLLLKNLFEKDQSISGIELNVKEVDAAIPFSCITTPEVVASCNTTPAHPAHPALPALAVDPKPLQLGSCYRAVSCLTGEPLPDATVSAAPTAPTAPTAPPAAPTHEQPRSVISSSLNGLPLTRSGFATGASASADESKKSLDENGNSVQGFSSPLSGSSHNKKPRRKKSSKNETVIKSQEIDGYQGNKDLNEVLRFIESNAESARSHKVRAKHKDDDDKGKKRSTERRKDKESKVKRASSLEELSRTTLADLTDHTDKPAPRPEPAKPKPERRSWGEDFADNAAAAAASAALELTDFQTVTKKRKPRRRTDEPEPPRRARPPAPPSDRSNDSNDDMDSVHSLHSLPADAPPARPAPPHPHASYADIARTRHNIPDLIESCNFYETEVGGEQTRTEPAPAAAPPAPDDYPSLEVLEARKKRDKPRPARKERNEGDAPAPDVVSDRRPAVILLDRASRPHDMDGVTFGFDINEQLVGARRPRCDLVRDALEGAVPVPVRAGPLRYLPPPPPPPAHQHTHLLQIVDYVGGAWEDVVRCGGGKVRYFSE